ncbi:MAG: methyltransferase domain-containing protein [Ilumatobacteraceae bacterium]
MSPPAPVWACPHCGLMLERTTAGGACANGHSFDRARDGHLNLLVGGRLGPNTVAGDTPDALAARRRFLSSGSYGPIAAAVADVVGEVDAPVLDIGCGEGWYLSHIRATRRFGIDISKKAVQMASRLLPDAEFVVASAYRMPVLDASVAVVMSVFAPHPEAEMHRVLTSGGRWVTVTPGPMHLHEMRPAFEGTADDKAVERRRRRAEPPEGAATAHHLEMQLTLTPATAHDLFFMTPLQWQTGAAHGAAATLGSVTVDVWVAASGPSP